MYESKPALGGPSMIIESPLMYGSLSVELFVETGDFFDTGGGGTASACERRAITEGTLSTSIASRSGRDALVFVRGLYGGATPPPSRCLATTCRSAGRS